MTQAELAKAAALSQGFISKLEKGGGEVADDMALRIAGALHIPLPLLTVDETELVGAGSTSHHRRRSSRITALAARRVDALSHLTSLSVNRLMSLDGASSPQLPELVDPVEAALRVRSVSGLGDGPIDSVVALAERLGVVVVRRNLGSVSQDGVSLVRPGSAPVLIVDRALPGDRQRFTVAHELGHVLLHHQRLDITDSEAEAEANRFAGSLLFPPAAALKQLGDLHPRRFSYLLELKQEWGVSMAALIEQARANDLLDSTLYRRMRMTLSDRGWNRVEPGPLDAEVPGVLPAVLDRQLDERGCSIPDLAEVALMNAAAFTKVYLAHRGGAAPGTKQDVVAAGGLG
jgi:Zn-dependent peptidase ImmA (M78 family)/transcriptional regulator with XRE-family HTH domain